MNQNRLWCQFPHFDNLVNEEQQYHITRRSTQWSKTKKTRQSKLCKIFVYDPRTFWKKSIYILLHQNLQLADYSPQSQTVPLFSAFISEVGQHVQLRGREKHDKSGGNTHRKVSAIWPEGSAWTVFIEDLTQLLGLWVLIETSQTQQDNLIEQIRQSKS